MSTIELAKIDAAADSMKAAMTAERRRLERQGYVQLCAEPGCECEAHPRSCYCDKHEPCDE